jgi:hypothetical protein
MVAWVKEKLGLRAIAMKLEALATHLKLRFVHVPEHYECQKVEG